MERRAIAVLALAALAVLAAMADSFLAGIARDNLANEGFVRTHQWTPADFGLAYEDVRIPSDGLQLAGWWMPGSGANQTTTVLLVHGYGSNMSKPMRLWAPSLHAAGYGVLAVDLRNHGASPDAGRGFVTYGVDEAGDVAAAVAYVRAHAGGLGVDPDRVVLYGGSMGAASVLNAAARPTPGVAAVIADSSFASFRFEAAIDGDAKGYPPLLVGLVVAKMDRLAPSPPTRSRPDVALASLQVPVLLAHCTDDTNISWPNFERLRKHAPAGTQAWTGACPTGLSAEHHVDGWAQPGYNATVLRFLDGLGG